MLVSANQPANLQRTFLKKLLCDFFWLPLGDNYISWKANGRPHMSRRDFLRICSSAHLETRYCCCCC